ncbi:hypothetical protein AURDEDRAFT_174693 [Auricularia subglabra TFB-10046 SS5]|nr:hypothetical protein AURDEDRAFT_174693 [Auricularia subglabra TFB-10046 SS5]
MKSARNNKHTSSACNSCRNRKSKCDGMRPACSACKQRKTECTYAVDNDRRTTRGRKCELCAPVRAQLPELNALRARVAELEAELAAAKAQLAGRPPSPTNTPPEGKQGGLNTRPYTPAPEPLLAIRHEHQPFFGQSLFPLSADGNPIFDPTAIALGESIDDGYLSAPPFIAEATGADLDALYGYPFDARFQDTASYARTGSDWVAEETYL